MAKQTPIIARPISSIEAIDMFSDPENLEGMSWAFSDWLEATNWLEKQGAPEETPEGNWNPMVERIKWVIENGKP